MELLNGLFSSWSGKKAESIEPLPESGSYRQYYRISLSGNTTIGVYNADLKENQAFIYLNRQLRNTGNLVPEIFAENLDNHVYLEQDLGNTTLFEYLEQIRGDEDRDEKILKIYKEIISAMPRLQVDASKGLDYSICYPRAEFDVQSMMWDMNYFKYCLLKPLKIGFYEQDLEDDFIRIVNLLLEASRNSFMFRDFQSRNIMLHQNRLFFIDFQGGRKGPMQYDLASLLFEAKTHLPDHIRQQLLEYYLDVFSNIYSWFNPNEFLKYYFGFVYLRLMQAMGAYGFRGYIERKPLFLQSLPYAVKTLVWLMDNRPIPLHLTSLPAVFEKLINLPRIRDYEVRHETFTVTINSFSYKNGIPHDDSGNGGGFVFDCRLLNNPGRFDEFKNLNGRDKQVIEFLENKPDVLEFLSQTIKLIDQAVGVYIDRGFNNLMVSYGCTGGQHRSVFMAEKLAEFIKSKYCVRVVVCHHELEKVQSE
jgi:aminoglycoside/choline kinase family phosphotransferase